MNWCDANGVNVQHAKIIDELRNYSTVGGKIYVGADSMYRTTGCVFVQTIALHNVDQQIAKYYFCRLKQNASKYKDLTTKINKEVELALNVALDIRNKIPTANIEVHVDIGKKNRNTTKFLVNQIRGWVNGLGFVCCIKPNSWASSDIADWHTK